MMLCCLPEPLYKFLSQRLGLFKDLFFLSNFVCVRSVCMHMWVQYQWRPEEGTRCLDGRYIGYYEPLDLGPDFFFNSGPLQE